MVEGTVRMVVIKFLIGVMVVVISAIWAWPVKWLLARRLVASRALSRAQELRLPVPSPVRSERGWAPQVTKR